MNKEYIKAILSIVAFIAAIIIGFLAMYLPPTGVIDNSVLWFTAQLLVMTSSLLGINIDFNHLTRTASTNNKEAKDNANT